jgi:hypothetical protein
VAFETAGFSSVAMASIPGRENPFLLTRPELLSAKRKIAQVANGYDPRKISFRGFECHSLDPTTFREQIRHNLLIHLTNAELGALVTLFDKDNDGCVNSAAFISEFLRLGCIERKKTLTQEQQCAEAIKKRKQKHAHDRELSFEKLRQSVVKTTFTEEEAKSAYDKFSMLAISHDVYHSSALNVSNSFSHFISFSIYFYISSQSHLPSSSPSLSPKGFVNGGHMSPIEFREQLRNSFHLYLSRGEVASLIHLFDENGDGSIDCDEFIRSFYRIGYEEREKFYYKHIQRSRKLQQLEALRQQKRDDYYLQRTVISLPTLERSERSAGGGGGGGEDDEKQQQQQEQEQEQEIMKYLTEENRNKVLNKIKEIAINYERKQHWGNVFLPFDATSLSPTRFREILKQQFHVNLTRIDLILLLEEFGINEPKTGERQINCKEFLSYFFHMGREEKEKILMKKLSLDNKLNKIKKNYENKLSKTLLERKVTAIEWPVLPQIGSPGGPTGGAGGSARGNRRGGSGGRSRSPVEDDDDGKSIFSMTGTEGGTHSSLGGLSSLSIGDDEKTRGNEEGSFSSYQDHDSISTHLSPSVRSSTRRSSSTRMYRKPSVLDTISPNRLALQQIKSEGSFVHAYPNASADTKVSYPLSLLPSSHTQQLCVIVMTFHRNFLKILKNKS